eukprot:1183095-Prorocentrum_minimum.AAC.1
MDVSESALEERCGLERADAHPVPNSASSTMLPSDEFARDEGEFARDKGEFAQGNTKGKPVAMFERWNQWDESINNASGTTTRPLMRCSKMCANRGQVRVKVQSVGCKRRLQHVVVTGVKARGNDPLRLVPRERRRVEKDVAVGALERKCTAPDGTIIARSATL